MALEAHCKWPLKRGTTQVPSLLLLADYCFFSFTYYWAFRTIRRTLTGHHDDRQICVGGSSFWCGRRVLWGLDTRPKSSRWKHRVNPRWRRTVRMVQRRGTHGIFIVLPSWSWDLVIFISPPIDHLLNRLLACSGFFHYWVNGLYWLIKFMSSLAFLLFMIYSARKQVLKNFFIKYLSNY